MHNLGMVSSNCLSLSERATQNVSTLPRLAILKISCNGFGIVITYRQSRDHISHIKSELQESFKSLKESQEELVAAKGNDKIASKKDTMLRKLDELILNNIKCREKLNTYLDEHTSV